jgi:hypothetical protein
VIHPSAGFGFGWRFNMYMQLAPRTNEMKATARIVRVLLMGRFQVNP